VIATLAPPRLSPGVDDASETPLRERRPVNIVWAFLITLGVTAVAITAMLLVRRRAPEGSYFTDGDRASGVFGVLATGFSVLLGFIIFLAFTSYDQARTGAETEALMVVQQVETAQLFPASAAGTLSGQLVCYGRSVVGDEWDRMRAGTIGDSVNPWGVALYRTLKTVDPKTASQQSAYDQWLGQTSAREEARLDRIHGAVGVIPSTIWIVLGVIAAVIFAYMLFFADPAEGAVTQAMLMGGVAAVLTVLFLLLGALDNPFHKGVGGLQPVAMERSLRILDQAVGSAGIHVPTLCDAAGKPT
jgi:amino acid transporter